MKKIISLLMMVLISGLFTAVMIPSNAYAADPSCSNSFLGFPAWYDGLLVSDQSNPSSTSSSDPCDVAMPDGNEEGFSSFIWRVALNILEMGIVGTAYVSVGFIIFGGFKYLTSRGTPDGIAKGKSLIINAIIGLIISLAAISIINLITSGLGI